MSEETKQIIEAIDHNDDAGECEIIASHFEDMIEDMKAFMAKHQNARNELYNKIDYSGLDILIEDMIELKEAAEARQEELENENSWMDYGKSQRIDYYGGL